MGFFIGMFVCNMLIPTAMIVGGILMYKKPPKNINCAVGYRTARSMKNKDTWEFAHHFCGRLWLKLGIILSVPTVTLQIPLINCADNIIGTVTIIIETVQLAVLICSILPVDRALKRTFDANGKRWHE